jgi:hypothetical protein
VYYLHFWSKLGHLDRVAYPTVEEAVTAAWDFEDSERLRITGSSEIDVLNNPFAGVNRPLMTTVITDEKNEDVETELPGVKWGAPWRLKHFLWHVTHNKYFMNESHWADRFEAASRGLEPGKKYCGPDCYNCKYSVDIDGNRIGFADVVEERPRMSNRTERIMQYFSDGKSRQEIATLVGLSYARVCQIIRERR